MEPVRTCVACRQTSARSSLLRVVLRDNQLIVDEKAVLAGRGAWVHPTAECLTESVSRGKFTRALRASAKPDASHLENRQENSMDKK